ncbi:hypothetical protein [Anaeromonas gelatinilytica]|nr:hypothetical protein [Anaeromonas gelatinilytica]
MNFTFDSWILLDGTLIENDEVKIISGLLVGLEEQIVKVNKRKGY